jgi:predicted thioredoxin/glutaredoxin
MEVKSLIGTLKGITTSEKTASEKNPEQPPAEKTATDATVDARMREVIASATQEKRAASGESLQGLLSKEAQALSDANDEAIVRRSKLAGTDTNEGDARRELAPETHRHLRERDGRHVVDDALRL